MKCLSLKLYCTASVAAMAIVLYRVADDDISLNLFIAWRKLTMIRLHYFIFANFIAMLALVFSLGALKFFFGPIKQGEKIAVNEKLKSYLFYFIIIVPSSASTDLVRYLIVPLLAACVHWVLFKRLKHLGANPQTCFIHFKMYLLITLLIFGNIILAAYFSRLMSTASEKNMHLFAVGLLEAVSFFLKLLAKTLRYAFMTCRRQKQVENALLFRYFSLFAASSFCCFLGILFYYEGIVIVSFYLIFKGYSQLLRVIRSAEKIRAVRHSQRLIDDLPTKRQFQNDPTCIVCLEEMQEAKILPCGHYFHASCLKSWMQEFDNCPTCRARPQLENNQPQAANNQPRPLRGQKRTQQLREDIAYLQQYQRNKRRERLAPREVPPSESGIEEACWIEPHSPNNPPRRSPAIQALHRQANRSNQENTNSPPREQTQEEQNNAEDEKVEDTKESEGSVGIAPPVPRFLIPRQYVKEKEKLNSQRFSPSRSPPSRKTVRDRTLISDVRPIDVPLGALQYSLPRPALTRRTISTEIARKTVETLNAKFTTLYKRPPRHTIPEDLLQVLKIAD